ncbi:hypothetical protein WOLCODRAFT_139916 [Wolfiporia cocos MD-104 SS10]|uniref:Uncharacterized protein n=1 Tax=Wolfiporia cocos (strain MD-104) TaxID=742152 RepID=A0A2H3J0L0_WOLCO|nr:hypothetical protein WOLCODRAFT_139916 [Wolfiporia cocos MD-104 SS10]
MAPPARSSTSTAPTKGKGSQIKSITGKQGQRAAAKLKQPLSGAERLKRLFTSLCAQIDGGHFANAVKTCDKMLRIEPHDPDALQTKLFLLLQTEQYVTALSLVDSLTGDGEGSSKVFEFEKAYSLYKLHREDEATEVLNDIKRGKESEENRGVMHLEAQLAYREGGYQSAFDLYNTLLDTAEPHSEEHADILTNLSAAQAHLDFVTSGFQASLASLPSDVADTLESAPPPAAHPLVSATYVPSVADAKPTPREKKPRARRIPKGVVLGVTPLPDPERWLKKSERSSAHAHGKKRGRGAGGGATQGIVENVPTSGAGGSAKGKKKGKK